ncbi:hypothetical protein [Bradyrhizobium iriomotense]|uniref:Uncharacterized protein n=1 Tax=Bradyrhizobium iriomotense TaxID=441950 RepID=A0ABQ6B8V4_9BRAD|nr:hypothetical protein [Bradyrhizobium iriomotense]GLR90824.1 hypothetical protein GCM10007857_75400 [Bradyrhizobium iriomotense]
MGVEKPDTDLSDDPLKNARRADYGDIGFLALSGPAEWWFWRSEINADIAYSTVREGHSRGRLATQRPSSSITRDTRMLPVKNA